MLSPLALSVRYLLNPSPPPPLMGCQAIWRGWGKETADASDYNHICLIAIWNEPVSTSLSTCLIPSLFTLKWEQPWLAQQATCQENTLTG